MCVMSASLQKAVTGFGDANWVGTGALYGAIWRAARLPERNLDACSGLTLCGEDDFGAGAEPIDGVPGGFLKREFCMC